MIPIGTNLRQNKLPLVTLVIIGVNVLFFIIEMLVPEPVLESMVFFFGYGPANWWNPLGLLTSMFLHADIYHIAFNMLFFWIFAGPIEERVGRLNFAIYYLICGAGSGLLYTVMKALASPGAMNPAIGASGAVSGAMGLFIYRCYYSKLKMVISPILLPRQFNIPVVPLIILWFLQNVLLGFLTLGANGGGVAYWGHIGGFIAGIIIGKVKGYGLEGRAENLRDKIMAKLESGGGWAAAEKELLKLLNVTPDDPELNLDLARLYAESGDASASCRFYDKAVRLLFRKNPADGAYALIEYNETHGKGLPPAQQVSAAEVLARAGDYENALKLYGTAAFDDRAAGPAREKALAYYTAVARHLGLSVDAADAAGLLMSLYPESSYGQKVRAALLAEPGKVFKPPVRKAPDAAEDVSTELREEAALGWIEVAQRFFMDPAFWSILLFLNIAGPFLFPRLYFSQSNAAPVALFLIAYAMTVLHRIGLEGWLLNFGKSQKQADREFELKKLFNQAKTAEMAGNHPEAARLYEELLAMDKKDAQARFNLARLYQKKLEDNARARAHFTALMRMLPEGHAFRVEAETFLARPSARG